MTITEKEEPTNQQEETKDNDIARPGKEGLKDIGCTEKQS